jgi:hypothetical protein
MRNKDSRGTREDDHYLRQGGLANAGRSIHLGYLTSDEPASRVGLAGGDGTIAMEELIEARQAG